MSGLNNLEKRIKYRGGKNQQDRMIQDKADDLRKAVLASYQAATAILEDGREFKCLINPDKKNTEKDNKILSIPFEDVCLNSYMKGKTKEGFETIGIKPGDVFTWKETGTHWLVFLRYLEETAYFRGEICECQNEVELNGKKYWAYIYKRRPEDLVWEKEKHFMVNKMNFTDILYITKTKETLDFFHRFNKIKIDGLPWEVVSARPNYGDGLIQVYLKEDFSNTLADEIAETVEPEVPVVRDEEEPYIEGPEKIALFDSAKYTIHNMSGGQWLVQYSDGKVINFNSDKDFIKINIDIKKPFSVIYRTETSSVSLDVKITSF